eukprot:5874420-Pleurochrysis_carterae.AAC.2
MKWSCIQSYGQAKVPGPKAAGNSKAARVASRAGDLEIHIGRLKNMQRRDLVGSNLNNFCRNHSSSACLAYRHGCAQSDFPDCTSCAGLALYMYLYPQYTVPQDRSDVHRLSCQEPIFYWKYELTAREAAVTSALPNGIAGI